MGDVHRSLRRLGVAVALEVIAAAASAQVGACLIACEPSDCEAGTVCDESTGLCVWPT